MLIKIFRVQRYSFIFKKQLVFANKLKRTKSSNFNCFIKFLKKQIKTNQKKPTKIGFFCELGRSRTPNLLIRSQILYPIELLVQNLVCKYILYFSLHKIFFSKITSIQNSTVLFLKNFLKHINKILLMKYFHYTCSNI